MYMNFRTDILTIVVQKFQIFLGGNPVKPMDVIRKAFNTALDDSDKYVHVKQVRAKSTKQSKETEKEKEKE